MSTLKVLAWGAVFAILGVIVFVRAPQTSGESGGKQASDIINSTASGLAGVANALEGYQA